MTADATDIVADFAALSGATPEQWRSLEWRLDHLYWIVDKRAKNVPFRLNEQQRHLVRNLWYRNIVLKARQLGFSTLMQLIALDQVIFNRDFVAAVISESLPSAGKLFKKIEHAYAHLPPLLQQAYPLASRAKETSITIAHDDTDGRPHPSTVSVSVSTRGGTVNFLHVSELGKIALKYPQRAQEIVTGAFPSVPPDGVIVVESTAEGAFGEFYELCEPAMKRAQAGKADTQLDWRLHFFPWYECRDYRLPDEDVPHVEVPQTLRQYFSRLEAELRIKLDPNQRAWYAKTSETLGHKMRQEYPSTPKEAFEQAISGAVYGDEMTRLREQGRLTVVPLDPNFPVNTFWDLGVNDATAIWFHQHIGLQHRWFYYREGSGKGLRYWWIEVCEEHRRKHGYRWGAHYLPHDAEAEILGEVVTTKRRILESLGMENIVCVKRVATIAQGIEITRAALGGNHWFYDRIPDEENGDDMGAGLGIKCLDGYQYEWDDARGIWSREPLRNWATHGADAWRQFAQGYRETSSLPDEDEYERRRDRGVRRSWRTA